MTKEIWIDCREQTDLRCLVELSPEVPVTGIIVSPEMGDHLRPVRNVRVAAYCDAVQSLAGVGWATTVVSPSTEVLGEARRLGLATALWADVRDADTLRRACADGHAQPVVFVTCADETNIPLELLIATFQPTHTKVVKYVCSAEEAHVTFGTLEAGCNGIVVGAGSADLLPAIEHRRRASTQFPIRLESVTVSAAAPLGMGVRVCVDTVEMLGPNDGMVIGSTAAGGLIVCAEVHPLPYMKLRPFRVNAGALHSYAACPNGMTAYLSEIASGDDVLVVSTAGHARPVAVGRAKMERRPLLKVSADNGATILSAILQNDWHVRVFDDNGRARSITQLRPGDRILASLLGPPRHVGVAVNENLWEG